MRADNWFLDNPNSEVNEVIDELLAHIENLEALLASAEETADNYRNKHHTQAEAIRVMREKLSGVLDDGWYRNGYVLAEESDRRSLLLDRVNEDRRLIHEALAECERILRGGK